MRGPPAPPRPWGSAPRPRLGYGSRSVDLFRSLEDSYATQIYSRGKTPCPARVKGRLPITCCNKLPCHRKVIALPLGTLMITTALRMGKRAQQSARWLWETHRITCKVRRSAARIFHINDRQSIIRSVVVGPPLPPMCALPSAAQPLRTPSPPQTNLFIAPPPEARFAAPAYPCEVRWLNDRPLATSPLPYVAQPFLHLFITLDNPTHTLHGSLSARIYLCSATSVAS